MTSRYRVEYSLKQHRRDEFIEWVKTLLATPFVLHAGSTGDGRPGDENRSVVETRRRYAEIFYDVEKLIENQLYHDNNDSGERARLRQLVPSIGQFFTKLPLERAFYTQDEIRSISHRRFVSPSFNDVRMILNTAQVMALATGRQPLKLVTFDGDVTLYADGGNIDPDSPIIPVLLGLLKNDIYVGIVTAAGYSEKDGAKYGVRLYGLLEAIIKSDVLTDKQKNHLLVMGGESNFLFKFIAAENRFEWIDPEQWTLPEVRTWSQEDITNVLNIGERVFTNALTKCSLPATIIRKVRGVGIVPLPGKKMSREQLEEMVLAAQKTLETSRATGNVQFCAFNGGSDVWVDIGDKDLGVRSLQAYLGNIKGTQTLHVGDQFAALGANDFKARLAATTVWIANPSETVEIIAELIDYIEHERQCSE